MRRTRHRPSYYARGVRQVVRPQARLLATETAHLLDESPVIQRLVQRFGKQAGKVRHCCAGQLQAASRCYGPSPCLLRSGGRMARAPSVSPRVEMTYAKKPRLRRSVLFTPPITARRPSMRHFNQGRFRQQVRFLQHQFLQDGNLPFSDILSTELIEQALTALQVGLIDCLYTPLVTLCVFLGQVLRADHSCRSAVAHLIAYRVARKQRPCSAETGAYCQARKRLPEEFFSQIARQTGCQLDAKAKSGWLWKNRRVHIFDGADRLDARHLRESTSLSPAAAAKTRSGISVDADRGHLFAGLRFGARCGHVPLRRQRAKRVQRCCVKCGRSLGPATSCWLIA